MKRYAMIIFVTAVCATGCVRIDGMGKAPEQQEQKISREEVAAAIQQRDQVMRSYDERLKALEGKKDNK